MVLELLGCGPHRPHPPDDHQDEESHHDQQGQSRRPGEDGQHHQGREHQNRHREQAPRRHVDHLHEGPREVAQRGDDLPGGMVHVPAVAQLQQVLIAAVEAGGEGADACAPLQPAGDPPQHHGHQPGPGVGGQERSERRPFAGHRVERQGGHPAEDGGEDEGAGDVGHHHGQDHDDPRRDELAFVAFYLCPAEGHGVHRGGGGEIGEFSHGRLPCDGESRGPGRGMIPAGIRAGTADGVGTEGASVDARGLREPG